MRDVLPGVIDFHRTRSNFLSASGQATLDRIPVTVVLGGLRSGKSRLIAQLRSQRAPGERWALLSNSADPAFGVRHGDDAGEVLPPDELFSVGGGCACCIAGPAFRTSLVRMLRAGPWNHLHIEVDPDGHPHRLVDQLRTPPFDQYLRVARLLLTLRAEEYAQYRSDDLLTAGGRLALATDFLLQADQDATSRDAAAAADLVRRLHSSPPWPRLERTAAGSESGWDPGSAALPQRPVPRDLRDLPELRNLRDLPDLPELPGWRVFSAVRPNAARAGVDCFRQWPAEVVAERRPFKHALEALARTRGVAGFQALGRTPRAWYRWRFGRGRGAGPLRFDEGSQVVETETAWRFDNRLCLWLAPGTTDPVLRKVESCLEELEHAMPDS